MLSLEAKALNPRLSVVSLRTSGHFAAVFLLPYSQRCGTPSGQYLKPATLKHG